jgi:site-specific recombinase XerD
LFEPHLENFYAIGFLGQRADEPMDEITKQDVVVFRNSLVSKVSAKTANHDLKTLKMLFKSARRDSAITEDPTEFVETIRRERGIKIKRPCMSKRYALGKRTLG